MKGFGLSFSQDVLALNPGLGETLKASNGKPSKYHNARSESRGMTFASGHEAAEIGKLILAEERKSGVFALRLQVRFPLYNDESYVADAVFLDESLTPHILDAKGYPTRDFLRKKKLFAKKYGQAIEEV